MTKTNRNTLVENVQRELIAYLGSGRPINSAEVAKAIDTTGLEIDDLDRLLRIRFALSDPVQAYLDKLPQRLRRIQTANNVSRDRVRGEIRGAVDWGQTVRLRYEENPKDRSTFVTRTPYTEYGLPENILVKTLLSLISEIALGDLRAIDQQWRRDRWDDDAIASFDRRFTKNVHLNRIAADSTTQIRGRHLEAARSARKPLYYKAYDLYRLYERLLNKSFEDTEAQAVLYDTITVPNTDKLFELACIFRLLRQFQLILDVRLQPIEAGSDPIARLKNDQWEIDIFHDQNGPLKFHERLPEHPTDVYLKQYESILDKHKDFLDRNSRKALFSGRPDIVIIATDRSKPSPLPSHVILGEIKHTNHKNTFSTGVKELFEYLEFARPREGAIRNWGTGNYLTAIDSTQLHGLILTDGIQKQPTIDNVSHWNYNQIEKIDPTIWLSEDAQRDQPESA